MRRRDIFDGTEATAAYARAVQVGPDIHVAGTTSADASGEAVGDDLYAQTKETYAKIQRAGKRREVGAGERFGAAVEAQRPAVAAAGAAASAPAVNPLLALQELPDATAARARALRRGHDLLAQLDRIRHALLLGRIAPSELTRLLATVRQRRQDLADPQLAGLLDEIELRASVELAKFDFV